MKGALYQKSAGVFVSVGTQGGGMETTAMTAVTQLTHHGISFVPLGYSVGPEFLEFELRGGSPWGAGTYSGAKGERQPSDLELKIAHQQGVEFAKYLKKFK